MNEPEVATEEKDYKYKFAKKDLRLVKKVFGSDRSRKSVEVRDQETGRSAIFKPTLNVRAKSLDVAEKRRTAAEYGEFIGSLAAKRMGIPVCDVELVKHPMNNPRSKSGRYVDVPGALSFIDLQPGESLTESEEIVNWFKNTHYDEFLAIQNPLGEFEDGDYRISQNNNTLNNNIELIIPAFESYIREKCRGTEQDVASVRQAIIEMTVYDCTLANTDRNDNNFGLAIGPQGTRFYPIYDNEYILGFSEEEFNIGKYSATSLQRHIDLELTSRLGVTSKPEKVTHSEMMTYLFSTYPKETLEAYKKSQRFTEDDLIEIMDECEGLSDVHKAYAKRIFKMRKRAIDVIKEEYIDKDGNIIEQTLPGNKPAENGPKVHGSGSRSKKSKSAQEEPKSGNSGKEEPTKQKKTPALHDGVGE